MRQLYIGCIWGLNSQIFPIHCWWYARMLTLTNSIWSMDWWIEIYCCQNSIGKKHHTNCHQECTLRSCMQNQIQILRQSSWLIPLSTILNIASIQLSSTHFNERRDIGAQVMRLVHYEHFALNKFGSPNSHTLIQCPASDHICLGFHTSLTKPNPCMNFSRSHNVHAQLRH